MLQVGDGRPTAWLRRKDVYFVLDIDVATGRIAMNDDDAFYVARPDRGQLFGFHPFDCGTPTYLTLERGRERAFSYDGVTVHLYDTAKKKGLGGLELVDDNVEAAAFIPGGPALALVGAAIYLWDPSKRTVVAWPLPAERDGFSPTAIAVDAAGTQVAVGFSDGAVLWVQLAALRARATRLAADVVTLHPAAALRCDKPIAGRYDDILGASDEDEAATSARTSASDTGFSRIACTSATPSAARRCSHTAAERPLTIATGTVRPWASTAATSSAPREPEGMTRCDGRGMRRYAAAGMPGHRQPHGTAPWSPAEASEICGGLPIAYRVPTPPE